jgi:hypothetical protein
MVAFSRRDLEALAGTVRLEDARSLVGAIEDFDEDEWSLWATIRDPEPNLAMIHHGGRGPLSSECDCADGEPGSFCRHSVAVALYYPEEWAG